MSSNPDHIRIFSPATVANVSCGFDVLGFCLDAIGDEMVIKKSSEKGIRITKIEGFDLPYETGKNVAGVAAQAIYDAVQPSFGFEIEIYKKIKPGSGVGSSSASASGSVFAINELLGRRFNKTELTAFAMEGEALASKSRHADNLAPGIFGGFTLVKSVDPLKVLELPTPKDLYAVILHPQIEIKTSEARTILPEEVPLQNAITQWSNVGSLVHALHTEDYELLRSSLKDVVIEPYRKDLIPHFDDVQNKALASGALGMGISGSGPSMFCLCHGEETANQIGSAFRAFYQTTNIDFDIYVSPINTEGIKVLDP